MKPPAVLTAAACLKNTSRVQGDRNDGQQFIDEGTPPVEQSALYGCEDAETNMIAAGSETHTHTRGNRQTESEEKQLQGQK